MRRSGKAASRQRDTSSYLLDRAHPGVEVAHIVRWRQTFPPHSHDELMIGLPQTGLLTFRRAGRTFHAAATTIAVVNPGEIHAGFNGSAVPLTYRSFYVSPAFIERNALPNGDHVAAMPDFATGVLAGDADTIAALEGAHRAVMGGAPPLARGARIAQALAMLYRRHAMVPAHRKPEPAPALPALRRVREMIEADLAGTGTIEALAAAVELSPFQLMRQFRRAFGVPVHAYVTQRRVVRAKQLLVAGQPPAFVAYELGFADQAHFTKRFKQFTGVTPGQVGAAAA